MHNAEKPNPPASVRDTGGLGGLSVSSKTRARNSLRAVAPQSAPSGEVHGEARDGRLRQGHLPVCNPSVNRARNSSSFPELHGASFVLALFYRRQLRLFNFTATDHYSPAPRPFPYWQSPCRLARSRPIRGSRLRCPPGFGRLRCRCRPLARVKVPSRSASRFSRATN